MVYYFVDSLHLINRLQMSSRSVSDQSSVASSLPILRGYEDESTISYLSKEVVKNPFHTLHRKTSKGKSYKINVYTTSTTPNRLIRSAITGEAFGDYRVGTYDEDLFFSVSLATGETGYHSNVLFFDSPNEYETLFQTQLDDQIKVAWMQKMLLAKEQRARAKKKRQ